ncbi:MAG: hypothetical protein OSB14_11805 [Planctomycetota bacterium]|nr:hypothetical protein [Planctomycetota bacterium]
MTLDDKFQEYFSALDRSGGEDRCYLCRRTSKEVKHFFGFDEDGDPFDSALYGLEDVNLNEVDIMSYRGRRPICAICQLNVDAIVALDESEILNHVLEEMKTKREHLWPH